MTKKAATKPLAGPTPQQRQHILEAQVFDDLHPGPVVRDFETLLQLIGDDGIEVGGKHRLFPMGRLAEFNARLTLPYHIDLERPQLRSYPNIQGLWLLLRASGIGVVRGRGKGARLFLHPAALESWKSLNPVEKYFSLLEIWLLHGRVEMIGDNGGGISDSSLGLCLQLWPTIPAEGKTLREPTDNDKEWLHFHAHVLALFHLFGLVEVRQDKPTREGRWYPKHVRPTDFGNALFALIRQIELKRWSEQIGEEMDESELGFLIARADGERRQDPDPLRTAPALGCWQSALNAYFPAWKHNLTAPAVPVRDGLWIFKVSLGKAWRMIALPSRLSLDDLAHWTLSAFDFDDEHLYEFSFAGTTGATITIGVSEDDEVQAAELPIGKLPLELGQSMTFLCDFGDNWQFNVRLERIETMKHRRAKPVILQECGTAPAQYRSCDE